MGVALEGMAEVGGLGGVSSQRNAGDGCQVLGRLMENDRNGACQSQASCVEGEQKQKGSPPALLSLEKVSPETCPSDTCPKISQ